MLTGIAEVFNNHRLTLAVVTVGSSRPLRPVCGNRPLHQHVNMWLFRVTLVFVVGACCAYDLGPAQRIKLNDGRFVPNFGIGTWLGFSRKGDRMPVVDDSVEKAVGWAIEAGYRHVDTASIYETETQVGRAIQAKINAGVVMREHLFVVTKLWNDRHLKEDVVPALKESLARLKLSYVDLYLVHWPIPQYSNGTYYDADYVETWKGMIEARDQGLARSIGVSNFNVNQLDRVINLTTVKPAMLQVEVNLHLQQPELLAFCRQHNITVTAYSPFGELVSSRATSTTPPPKINDPKLVEMARKYTKTVPQIILRYLVELGVIPIPKSVNKQRIRENLNVFNFTLTPQDTAVLKSFDRGYRTIKPQFWKDSKYFPFEK
ncbi:aldo-keto reductase AKR2E4-like isoform X1 [Plodia interpunctella]|uniref:aldo-keto reductase AKR2E4-like isoform X1 n=2 Tax=Plodia interpunctella TaxID=58824 RepID=UPI002367D080|nr:aldo-keto reductase AKR2E4-like isoform X1 [Plodia interpunctella]